MKNFMKEGYIRTFSFFAIKNNIRLFFRNIKWFFQRGCYGVARGDVWDLDYYIGQCFANGLKLLAKEKNSYPDRLGFDSIEKWSEYLADLGERVSKFSGQDMFDFENTEAYEEQFNKLFDEIRLIFRDLWD